MPKHLTYITYITCNSGGSAKEFGIFSCLCPIYNCEFIDNEIVLYLFHLHILSIIVIS